MPTYRTLTTPGLLDVEARQAYAKDVTEIHCDVTGAPPSFVHVVYADDDGQLADYADVGVEIISASVVDIDASYTMESGVSLPEPGSPAEAEWKAMGAST